MARKVSNGTIKYIIQKDVLNDRWMLTIHRKLYGWIRPSDTVITCIDWSTACRYATDHWTYHLDRE